MIRSLRRLGLGAFLSGLAAYGCVVTVPAPPPQTTASEGVAPEARISPVDGPSLDGLRGDRDGWTPYRILTKDDFQAKSSYGLWGSITHGAEICTFLFPVEGDEDVVQLHAMMNPGCSFWNHNAKTITRIGRLAGAVAPVMIAPEAQPEWYILQHEQLHFAIAEVAARRYARTLAKLSPERRDALAVGLYTKTLERMKERNAEMDGDTSGTFDRRALEKWVRVLQAELKELCGKGPTCRVRVKDPEAQ